jgi:hypothetical protein
VSVVFLLFLHVDECDLTDSCTSPSTPDLHPFSILPTASRLLANLVSAFSALYSTVRIPLVQHPVLAKGGFKPDYMLPVGTKRYMKASLAKYFQVTTLKQGTESHKRQILAL